ncbi:MAG: hypothetical protein QGH06_00445 [Lutibacter sp.]|jgi:hypothetical protein|nr:hypothetical protein [Lutibacter sp.]
MYRLVLLVIVCVLGLSSCSYFDRNAAKATIPQVDTIVDFHSVDAFPLFPKCEDIPSRKKQQICFQLAMSEHIYAALKGHRLQTGQRVNDTVWVRLQVDASGKTSLSSVRMSAATRALLPNFDSVLQESIHQLPLLKPAIKRQMPVTTAFNLPVVLTYQ